MNSSRRHAIVVGGGAIGTACAYYLAKAAWRVTLVDQDQQGRGATAGNCGLLAYHHVRPLNEPGAVLQALKALGRRHSPLYLKLRPDPALWRWLAQFARRCTAAAVRESAVALQALADSSARLYRRLFEEEPIAAEWRTRGCLLVYRSAAAMNAYARTDAWLRARFGIRATRYDGQALVDLEPALRPGAAAGAWYYPQDAQVRPEKLLGSWRRVLEAMDVAVQEHCCVEGFAGRGHRATAALTSQGELPADAFVVATGAWTPLLSRPLGCRLPIQPGKGYSITTARPTVCPQIPILFPEHRVAVTPMESGYRLGSTLELAGYDQTLHPGRVDLLKRSAQLYLHEPWGQPAEAPWCGWRPMTCDGRPIIDRSPALHNVVIAAGHNTVGLTLAPATGRLVAEVLSGRRPHLDVRPFSATRF